MYITITGGKVTPEQAPLLEEFLAGFLPRMKEFPGVRAIYHFYRPDKGDDQTIVIWENEEAAKAYRTSALIEEPLAFEQAHNLVTSREGYPLIFAATNQA